MNVSIKGNKLIIEIEMQKPAPSASGKTMIVATTGGNQVTSAEVVKGKPIVIGLNAYFKP